MSETPKRPGVILAAAILLFIFGAFSILGLLGAIIPYVTPSAPPEKKLGNQPAIVDPTPKLVQEEPGIMGVMTGFALLEALLGIAKIWAGIGILRLRPTARTAGIVVSILTILLTIGQSVHSALYVVPAFLRIFAEENAPEIAGFIGIVQGVLWFATGLGIVVSIAIWLTVIFLLNSQRARDAFAGVTETPISEPEPERCRDDGYDDDDYPRSSPQSSDDARITDRPR